jgi:hypothetical protein
VAYLGGDGIGNVDQDGTDWPSSVGGGNLAWSTVPFNVNAKLQRPALGVDLQLPLRRQRGPRQRLDHDRAVQGPQ